MMPQEVAAAHGPSRQIITVWGQALLGCIPWQAPLPSDRQDSRCYWHLTDN